MMTRKTAANLIVMIVAMFLMALILTPTLAHATGKPEPVTPAPTSSTSSATAASQAKAAIDLSLANSATGGHRCRPCWRAVDGRPVGRRRQREQPPPGGSFVQPAGLHATPMAPIAACAPLITQEATSGRLIVGGASKATGKTDLDRLHPGRSAQREGRAGPARRQRTSRSKTCSPPSCWPGLKPSAVEFAEPGAGSLRCAEGAAEARACRCRYVSAFPAPASAPVACSVREGTRAGQARAQGCEGGQGGAEEGRHLRVRFAERLDVG
jgi:hypothetical protein